MEGELNLGGEHTKQHVQYVDVLYRIVHLKPVQIY